MLIGLIFIAFFTSGTIFYLVGAFYSMDHSPRKWEEGTRGTMAILTLLGTIALTITLYNMGFLAKAPLVIQ